jgi:uncharacterized surface protein with fasciclin (FAS1) repeats
MWSVNMADLLQTANEAGSFKTLLSAVETAGLSEILKSPGPFTVLAPTDEAFASLPAGSVDELLQDVHKLKRVLLYHVLSGDVRSDDLNQIEEAPTVEGSVIAVEHANGIKVNDAQVTQLDILTDNGVIHVIDSVLIPAMLAGSS